MTGPLTPAEERVLRAKAQGLQNDEVAHLFRCSRQTVKNLLTSAYRKLDADNIVSALVAMGWVQVPGESAPQQCQFVGRCGRPFEHRGHHGGFRPIA